MKKNIIFQKLNKYFKDGLLEKIAIFFMLLFLIFNSYGKEIDSKYSEAKKNNKDEYLELSQYYDKKREIELNKIFSELDDLYKNNRDEKILKYIEENEDNYSPNIWNYYSKKITEKCDNNCSKRLIKLYNYLYEKTGNIEILASILKYREIIGESEYNKIKEICIKNNSVTAVKEDIEQKSREIEEKNVSNKIKLNNKSYRVIQEEKPNLKKLFEKVILCTDEENLYLILNNSIIRKIENYYSTVASPYLQTIDLNNDSKDEFTVWYTGNIYVFKFENGKISKIFDGYENISVNKYLKYEVDKKEVKTVLSDDFKHSIIQKVNQLPNEKEMTALTNILDDSIENEMYYNFIVIKDKIIMNLISIDDYVYEIVFDKDYKYKVKTVKKKEI